MISVIVPAYNEEKRIEKTLDKLKKENPGEIIVVFDGDDRTPEIVGKFKKAKILQFKKRLGKGGAFIEGFKKSKGDIVVMVDADYGLQKNVKLELITKHIKQHDAVIGSRKAEMCSSIFRKIISKSFMLIREIVLPTGLKDTQCGFKAFKRQMLEDVVPKLKRKGYSFDAEIFYLARGKYSIKEVPVEWVVTEDSKINPVTDSIRVLWGILCIRFSKKK